MNNLIVRWPAQTGGDFHWLECDENAHHLADGRCTADEWPSLVARARERALTVLLPTRCALITAVTVPLKQQRHLQRVLPFLLEDVVTSAIDDLHIVAGRKMDDERLQTIAVAHDVMQNVISTLAASQLQAQCITVDALCLPPRSEAQLLIESQQAVLVLNDGSAHELGVSDLDTMVPLLVGEHALQIYRADSQVTLNMNASCDEIDHALAFLARHRAHASNLLQGVYAPKQTISGQFGAWKWPSAIALSALCVHYAYAVSDWAILSKRNNALHSEMQSVYRHAFAGAKSEKPYSDMRRQMKAIEGGGIGFLSSLEKITAVLHGSSNKITAINFDGERGDLKISLMADDLAALNSVQADLQSSGINVEMGQASATENGYSGTLTLHEGKKK